jgi:hypothetical protein
MHFGSSGRGEHPNMHMSKHTLSLWKPPGLLESREFSAPEGTD